jgi:hypothetical protein
MESFLPTLKVGAVHRDRVASREEAGRGLPAGREGDHPRSAARIARRSIPSISTGFLAQREPKGGPLR